MLAARDAVPIVRVKVLALPDDVARWLIDCRDAAVEQSDTALGRYLRRGRRLGIRRGYLVSRRRPWFSQETRADCPIVFSYFNRERPQFIRNLAGAVPLNNWLIVEPRDDVDVDELHAALTSKAFIARLDDERRVYGGGLWKLEPKELEAVKLPRWK